MVDYGLDSFGSG